MVAGWSLGLRDFDRKSSSLFTYKKKKIKQTNKLLAYSKSASNLSAE